MPTPPITPLQADALLRAHPSTAHVRVCGWLITEEMDRSVAMTPPPGTWAEETYLCSGETCSPITVDTVWVEICSPITVDTVWMEV